MSGDVMVRWTDDTVQTYHRVNGTMVSEDGTTLMISTKGVTGHIDPSVEHRTVSIPMCNVRWWGAPPSGGGNW